MTRALFLQRPTESLCRGDESQESRADNPLCSFINVLDSIPFLQCGVFKSHSDPSGQDALSESSVGWVRGKQLSPPFFSHLMKRKPLLSTFDCG